MPPARAAIWDHFHNIREDIQLPELGIALKAKKNASYDNAWCRACVDKMLEMPEYGLWMPGGGGYEEGAIETMRQYRVFAATEAIRGQPKNMERHIRRCQYTTVVLPPLPPPVSNSKKKAASAVPPEPVDPALSIARAGLAGPSTSTLTSLPTLDSSVPAPAPGTSTSTPTTLPILPAATSIPPGAPATPSHTQQRPTSGSGSGPTPRLTRERQAELDADIYNLFLSLGVPFDARTCLVFGQFVGRWIPGTSWGEDQQ